MSEIKVDKISPQSGTALAVGDSGDTITIPSGATITNSGTANGFGGGKILQVLQTTKTDTTTSSTTSYVDISGMSVDITPASGTKVLVTVGVNISQASANNQFTWQVVRDSTAIGIGDAASSRTRASSGGNNSISDESNFQGLTWLDTHGADGSTAVTYKLQWKVAGGTAQLNMYDADTDNSWMARMVSTITVQEIGA